MAPLPSLTVQLDPEVATIGDPIHYQIIGTLHSGEELVIPPQIVETLLPARPLGAPFFEQEQAPNGQVNVTANLKIAVYQTGLQDIPTQSIYIQQSSGTRQTVELPSVQVEIQSLLSLSQGQLQALKPPRPIEAPWWWNPMGWTGLTVALALVGWGVWRWVQIRKKRQQAMDIPSETPAEWGVRQLGWLERQDQTQVKTWFTLLTQLVKGLLSRVLDRPVDDMTSAELKDWISSRLDVPTCRRIGWIVDLADQVKFAKYEPKPDDFAEALRRVRDLIPSLTRPKEPEHAV